MRSLKLSLHNLCRWIERKTPLAPNTLYTQPVRFKVFSDVHTKIQQVKMKFGSLVVYQHTHVGPKPKDMNDEDYTGIQMNYRGYVRGLIAMVQTQVANNYYK
jgi:hypothetical protein